MNKWMNKKTNEWMREITNEWEKEQMNEKINWNKLMIEGMKKWMNGLAMNEGKNEWIRERANWMNEQGKDQMNE